MGKRAEKGSPVKFETASGFIAPQLDLFGPDPLTERLTAMIGEFVEELVREELDQVLAAPRYRRAQQAQDNPRAGYRHGTRKRNLSTSMGKTKVTLPRARLFDQKGQPNKEFQSKLIRKYQRRTQDLDATIVQAYLCGTNTRRLKGAFKHLLKDVPLSKSAVSRVIQNLKAAFDDWKVQDLSEHKVVYLYLDAIHVKVRVNKKVQSVPMLVALAVLEGGQKIVLGLWQMGSESKSAWKVALDDLVARGMRAPLLCIVDGNKGLGGAVKESFANTQVQRCAVHKLRNLLAHAPNSALQDLKTDYHKITEAKSERTARRAYACFVKRWRTRCSGAVESLEEAGDELLTFYRFPKSQWKSLRTTNCIERLNGEFRRRIKVQSSFPDGASVKHLFYGLLASGQIKMRRIDGWQHIDKALKKARQPSLQEDLKSAA